jgi:hypothetical protein
MDSVTLITMGSEFVELKELISGVIFNTKIYEPLFCIHKWMMYNCIRSILLVEEKDRIFGFINFKPSEFTSYSLYWKGKRWNSLNLF